MKNNNTNDALSTKLQVWQDFKKLKGLRTMHQIYLGIKDGAYKIQVDAGRSAYKTSNKSEYDSIKKSLPAFTPSAIFKDKRRGDDMEAYTGLISLDIDGLLPGQATQVAEILKMDRYAAMVFISPSGCGVKCFVVVDSSHEFHKQAYRQVLDYYKSELSDVKFDEQTSDLSRLCFMSYDPNAYFSTEKDVFHIDTSKTDNVALAKADTSVACKVVDMHRNEKEDALVLSKKIKYIEFCTNKKQKFEKDNRNNYVFALSCRANRLGMPKDTLMEYLFSNYTSTDFGKGEISSTVEGVYKNNVNEHGTYHYPPFVFGKSNTLDSATATSKAEAMQNEIELDSPFVSEYVKTNLPQCLKNVLPYLNKREQDVFIIGALTALSGCISVSGNYRNKVYRSPMYSFVSAPPASGKGALKYCLNLVLPYHQYLRKQSDEALARYNIEMAAYNEALSNGEKGLDKPEKPVYKALLLPANSSCAQFTEDMLNYGEKGLVVETEADTMVKMLESDFGDYSDILRSAFEHERISMRRKTDKLNIEMFEPQLAVALAGTPKQLSSLLKCVENGLFSRFNYYVYRSLPVWDNVTPTEIKGASLQEILKQDGNRLLDLLIKQNGHPASFRMETKHWEQLNEVFSERVKSLSCFWGEEGSANVFRLGVSTFRLAMVLSTLRMMEDGRHEEEIFCNDTDFRCAMELSETFFAHLEYAFKIVKNTNEVVNKQMSEFLNLLPESFDRKVAIDAARKNGVTAHERTLDKYLKRLVEYGYLTKDQYNRYFKGEAKAAA